MKGFPGYVAKVTPDESSVPDLLYALRRLINELPSKRDWLDPDLEAIARQAIAKAEGLSVKEPSRD